MYTAAQCSCSAGPVLSQICCGNEAWSPSALAARDLVGGCMAQVEDLARLSFKRPPLYVGIDDSGPAATREGLEQGYCIVPSAQRFLLLFTFLKRNVGKKAGPPRPFSCS